MASNSEATETLTWAPSRANRSALRRMFYGAEAGTIATSLLILLVTLGSGVALARSLGPVDRGLVAAAMLWPTILAATGSLGLAEGITYLSGKEGDTPSSTLCSGLAVAVGQSIILMSVGAVLLPHLLVGGVRQALPASMYYLWLIPIYLASQYAIGSLQGHMRLRAFNFARLSVHVVYTAILLALWQLKAVTVTMALTASLAAWLLSGLVALWFVWRLGHWQWRLDRRSVAAVVSFGLKLHVGNVATIIASKLDILALTLLASTSALGIYVVAATMSPLVGLVPTALSMVLYPKAVRLSRQGWESLLGHLLLAGLVLGITAVPLMSMLLPPLIPIVFGKAFIAAVPVAVILVPGYLLRGYAGVLVAMLRGAGRPIRASVGEVLGLSIFALFLPILTSRYGSIGTAVALTASSAVMLGWIACQAWFASGTTIAGLLSIWKGDIRLVASYARRGKSGK